MAGTSEDFNESMRRLEVEFLHGVPVHLTEEAIDQIKEIILTHVIGEPINVFIRQNLYKNDPEKKWYDKGWNDLKDIQRLIVKGENNDH